LGKLKSRNVRWRVPLSCVLILGLALSPACAATLQSEYLDIYLKLNDSERLEHTGDFRGALEGFEDCYTKLHRIHVNDPDWEPVLVTSRMEDCRAKIAELEPKVEATPIPPINPEINTGPEVTAPKTGDMAAMQERLLELEQELSATKKELADTTLKYHDSQVEVQTLHAQLDGVNQQLAALKSSQSVDQNMGDLMARNKDLTDRLAAAQTEIKAFTSNPHSATSKLAEQLKLVREKLDASEAANAGLTETTTTLQQQLDQAQHDLAVANNQLATTGPGSPQYLALKHENEVMRGILQREIQEQSRRDGAKRLAQEEFDRLKITSRVLQEQLDILGSPMTPPNNDEERELLASIKVAPSEVTPMVDATENGNHFAATANGAPISESNTPGIPAPSSETPATNAAPADTNAAPSVAADTNAVPATTNSETASTTGDTNAPPATNAAPETNAAPSVTADTNAVPATPDTNAPSVTTTTNATPGPSATDTNAPGTASPPSSTNASPALASDTNTAPAVTNTPSVVADTNAAAAPSTNAAPTTTADTNTPPAVTSTNTATTSSDKSDSDQQHQADVTRYGNKPRLPDDMREVAQEATDLFENKHYDEAAAKYQTIIDKYPESLYAWSNLGVVRSQQGKLQDAMKALQQAVKLSPNDAFSYRNLGIVYYQLGQNDAAIDALERSIALEPKNVYSHDYLGCACSQKGWEEVAEKEFLKAIDIDPDFPDAHYNLAIVYAVQKPPALALARREYKRALDLGLPRDPRLEKLLGL
jgi:Flp pilus assembly protein TadD